MEPTLIDHAAAPGAPGTTAPVDRIVHGAIHLDVTDPERSLGFWRDVVGLSELSRTADEVHLGAGARELVVLHPGAVRGAGHGHAGLYHVALHVPDIAEFARVIARLATARVPQAPTDHIFSMATYLTDPDGLGLEMTLETPERFGSFDIGPRGIALYDSDGRLRGPTERLDLDPVLAHLGGAALDAPLADGTIVGHVHLHVPDVAAALRFYRDAIGFDVHMDMPAIGMADLSAGGRFPHRFALNSWAGPAAAQPPAGTAGMRYATLVVPDAAALAAVRERLRTALATADDRDGGLETIDPAGNRLRIVTAASL